MSADVGQPNELITMSESINGVDWCARDYHWLITLGFAGTNLTHHMSIDGTHYVCIRSALGSEAASGSDGESNAPTAAMTRPERRRRYASLNGKCRRTPAPTAADASKLRRRYSCSDAWLDRNEIIRWNICQRRVSKATAAIRDNCGDSARYNYTQCATQTLLTDFHARSTTFAGVAGGGEKASRLSLVVRRRYNMKWRHPPAVTIDLVLVRISSTV